MMVDEEEEEEEDGRRMVRWKLFPFKHREIAH
jgi:hypothetical protein